MSNFLSALFVVILAMGVFALTQGIVRFDFYVWRLKHPDAPEWTYYWGRK